MHLLPSGLHNMSGRSVYHFGRMPAGRLLQFSLSPGLASQLLVIVTACSEARARLLTPDAMADDPIIHGDQRLGELELPHADPY